MRQQQRLSTLTGKLNKIMRTTKELTPEKEQLIAEIDAIERSMQSDHLSKLTPKKRASMKRAVRLF